MDITCSSKLTVRFSEQIMSADKYSNIFSRQMEAIVYLTNRFHVAVRLFSNRSQMMSKCGNNKQVAHEAIAKCVTDVLTTF